MSHARVIGGGGWVRTAARVFGVGILSLFVNAVIFYLAFLSLYEKRNSVLLWLLIPVAVLIGPVYGRMEYRAAQYRAQRSAARAAKIVAILILVANAVLLAWVWLFYWTFEHVGIR